MQSLSERDLQHIWHPYTQMKLSSPAIAIQRAEGVYLIDEHGERYIDAVSSWWVNIHGHCHPYLTQKISEQLATLEHVIFAGFTHQPAVELAERLLKHVPGNQGKVFFSDNGSTAIEVGLKMAFQYWYNQGIDRRRVIAFENSYHGDTFGAMAASQRQAFNAPFNRHLFEVDFIPTPHAGNIAEVLSTLESLVAEGNQAAFIFEPLVQGAGGMLMYEGDYLDQILRVCKAHQVLCIADEVMTGFGRTGALFACDYLSEKPDIVCLSKGLTGGVMAFGVTTCTDAIYEAFYSDDRLKTFFHGHSYCGNPLACAAALASLDLVEQPEFMENIRRISASHEAFRHKIQSLPSVRDCRQQGTILAVEWQVDTSYSYFSSIRDQLYQFFLDRKVLCRPLGNVIYLMPPYCITQEELEYMYGVIQEGLLEFGKGSTDF
ncbi:MAG: adenosylmethionine--8-amino-7-oxononanoate transaminase [Microscillaceae bacterium]|nr:adenosylmethionine--8-amino-7-oxononanoate transaminase [Microscillaceae bacterium]